MLSFVKMYRLYAPILIQDLIRAFRLSRSGLHIKDYPDVTLIGQIHKFVGKPMNIKEISAYYFSSPSQIHQDYLAHLICDNRFFVEFGACDGIESSNTYYLE